MGYGRLGAVASQLRLSAFVVFSVVGVLGCGEDVFSGVQVKRVTPALEVSDHADQCSSIDVGGVGGSSAPAFATSDGRPDFWFEQDQSENGVAFKFGSGSATKETKLYRNVFFENGKLDRFVIESLMGDFYVVSIWGSSECNTCPPDAKTEADGSCGAQEALQFVKDAMGDD